LLFDVIEGFCKICRSRTWRLCSGFHAIFWCMVWIL